MKKSAADLDWGGFCETPTCPGNGTGDHPNLFNRVSECQQKQIPFILAAGVVYNKAIPCHHLEKKLSLSMAKNNRSKKTAHFPFFKISVCKNYLFRLLWNPEAPHSKGKTAPSPGLALGTTPVLEPLREDHFPLGPQVAKHAPHRLCLPTPSGQDGGQDRGFKVENLIKVSK